MSFYIDYLRNSPEARSPFRIADPAFLEPVFRAKVELLMAESLGMLGIKLMIFETYRSNIRQEQLYLQKATQLRTVGVHGYGLACDVVKDVLGEPSWKGDFSFLAKLARKHDLVSGIDWGMPGVWHSFVDGAHLQRIAIADQDRLFDGSWYPDDDYSPYGTPLPTTVQV